MSTTILRRDHVEEWHWTKSFAAWVASWFNRPAPPTMADDEPIPTRASLLQHLKDPADHASWDQFHRTYRGLIHGVARRAGLNETEADEVVQDTLIAVARKMPEFRYDPAKDSFKGWLLQLTRWQIAEQFRKRSPQGREPATTHSSTRVTRSQSAGITRSRGDDDTARTATVERIADPAGLELAVIWDEEWRKHILDTALAMTKRRVNPAHYEIYYLNVILGKPVAEVKRSLGVSAGQVYLARHRVGAIVKRAIRKLERSFR